MSESAAWAIGTAGRAATELGPRLPTYHPDSADHELTECVVPGAQIRAASIRGLMHRQQRQPRQDRFSVVYDDATATVLVTVCDGVGGFELSQEAAAFVAAETPRAYLEHRAWRPALADVNRQLIQFVEEAPKRSRLMVTPTNPRMATTVAAVAIRFEDGGRRTASVAWTDDTTVWALDAGGWSNLTPDGSPEAERGAIHSTKVKALPHPVPRVMVVDTELTGGALFVTTDGVGGPLLRSQQVRDTLASWWAGPPDVYTFAQQVAFARKGELDDRTVVGVWFDST